MKILITGATGFVGRHVVDSLIGDCNLALIVRDTNKRYNEESDSITNIVGSLNRINEIKNDIISFSPDVCIHLAWEGIPDFSAEKSIYNLNISINFLNILLENTDCKKYIITGSCYEYGDASGICRESDLIKINSYISWAKHALNSYISLRTAQKGAQLYWLRCFYLFGSGQRREAIIPLIARAFLRSETPVIKNPFNANDFVHIRDVARAIRLILERNPEAGIYNLGLGKATQIAELCAILERKVCNSTQFSDSLKKLNNNMQGRSFWSDIAKAKKSFGWEPQIGLEGGIEELLNSIKSEMKW